MYPIFSSSICELSPTIYQNIPKLSIVPCSYLNDGDVSGRKREQPWRVKSSIPNC